MCGISGCAGGSGRRARVADEQLRLLHHRGPDARGRFEQPGAIIAQNRLAIIDLVTGDPPVTNEDAMIGAVLNGEIYNFRALREELQGTGHELRTQGDTEVLAHLAELLDPVALARRLDGMFAFAVYDAPRERLVLGRDRVGKKPLYYWSGPGGQLVFASEIKGVLAHPDVPRELDPRAIPAYLTFGYVPTPHTFFAGVRSVPPGHVLVLERDGEPRLHEYWSPPLARAGGELALDLRGAGAADAVRGALERAVERRLISDVPLGASGAGWRLHPRRASLPLVAPAGVWVLDASDRRGPRDQCAHADPRGHQDRRRSEQRGQGDPRQAPAAHGSRLQGRRSRHARVAEPGDHA
jgi:asparagine synthase (glutamine-hydrolysing)